MKLIKTTLIAAVLLVINMQGMNLEEKNTAPKPKIVIKQYQKLPYPKEVENFGKKITIFGGKNKENKKTSTYTEYLDLKEKCAFAQDSFKNLITDNHTKSKGKIPFILAVATTEGSEDGSFHRCYFMASCLCRWMLEADSFKRKSDESFSQHIITKKPILELHFFAIDSLTKEFRYVGDEKLFTQNSNESLNLKFNIIAGLEDGDALNNYGDFCYTNKNIQYAEKAFELAANKYDHAEAIYNLGFLYQQQNKFNLAKRYHFLSINKHNDVKAIYNLGFLYQQQNKFNLAEKYYLLAIKKNKDADAMNNLGSLYYKQNKFDLAEHYYILAIEHNHANAMNNLGFIYEKENKFDLAEQCYLLAITEHNDAFAMNNLGLLYKQQNKLNLAIKYFNDAINKGCTKSYYHLGMIAKNLDDLTTAKEYFTKAAESGDEDAKKELLNL